MAAIARTSYQFQNWQRDHILHDIVMMIIYWTMMIINWTMEDDHILDDDDILDNDDHILDDGG